MDLAKQTSGRVREIAADNRDAVLYIAAAAVTGLITGIALGWNFRQPIGDFYRSIPGLILGLF
ncbi:hypothetical protein [Micromonospora chersina]|uniref:hypothetical protein n=1 Tax=Micromonospora chersina TaxID=47854 RepID=UPI0033AB7AF0